MKTKPTTGIHQVPTYFNRQNAQHRNQPFLAVDTETTGLDFDQPYSYEVTNKRGTVIKKKFPVCCMPYTVSWCDHKGSQGFYEWSVDPYTRKVDVKAAHVELLQHKIDSYPEIVFHNALFDIRVLESIGITVPWEKVQDTLAASHIYDSDADHRLKQLGITHLDIEDDDEQILKKLTIKARAAAKREGIPRGPKVGSDYWMVKTLGIDKDISAHYAVQDTVRTALLWIMHKRHFNRNQILWNHYRREQKLLPAIYQMKTNGVSVRPIVILRETRRYEDACDLSAGVVSDIARDQYDKPDFNIQSHPQLANLLFHHLGLPVNERTPSGNPSTAASVLRQLYENQTQLLDGTDRDDPRTAGAINLLEEQVNVLSSILSFQKSKTARGYIQNYLTSMCNRRKKIFPSFHPWGTKTTRFSSKNPNAQNIGKDSEYQLRVCFGPTQGHLWYPIDYSQLEIRLMSAASGDPTLTKILAEGLDQHQITADIFGISRKRGKNINFAWQYGAGAAKLSAMAGTNPEQFIAGMRSQYPGVVDFMERKILECEQTGITHTLFGYPLQVARHESYKGINYTIQGTAGDIVKNATIAVHQYILDNDLIDVVKLILNIHDELVFEVPINLPKKHIRNIAEIMAAAGDPIQCPTPVDVSCCRKTWAEPRPARI